MLSEESGVRRMVKLSPYPVYIETEEKP